MQILHAFKKHFGCGVVRRKNRHHGDRFCYRVRDRQHLLQTIIPFFEKCTLKTKKNVDFKKFRRCVHLMESNAHLTSEGLTLIRSIAEEMNNKRALRQNKGAQKKSL